MTRDVSREISRLRRRPNDIAGDLVNANSANRGFNVADEHGCHYTSRISGLSGFPYYLEDADPIYLS